MHRNRALHLILALLVLLGLLAGCSGPAAPAENSEAPGTGEPAPASDEAALDPVTLKFRFIVDKVDYWDEVWAEIAAYVEPTLNCEFETVFTPIGDYANKLTVWAASGDDFDLCFDASWIAYNTMTANGSYMDVSKLLPEYAPNYYQQLQDAGLVETVKTKDGKIFALPWICQFTDYPYLMTTQNSVVEGMGLSLEGVDTFEEMDALFQQAKEKAAPSYHIYEFSQVGGIYGGDLRTAITKHEYAEKMSDLYGFTYSIGEYLDTGKLTLVPIEQTEAFKDCVYWTTKWTEEGIIPSDYATNEDVHTSEDKSVKLFTHVFHEATYAEDCYGYSGTDSDASCSALYPDHKYSSKSPLANLFCINENAANPERTLMFIDQVSTDQKLFNLVLYGIEGETYTLDDKGNAVFDDDKNNYHTWGGQWGFWRQNMFLPTSTQPKEMWEELAARAESGQSFQDPLAGFVPDVESIKNDIALRTTLSADKGEPMTKGIGTSTETYEQDIAAYIQQQKDSGGTDRIQQELQRQVDEYLGQ